MTLRLKRPMPTHRWRAGLLVSTVLLAGCCVGSGRGGVELARRRPHPMVVAARANRVNLFGDLAGATGAGYFSRTSVSLRRHTHTELGANFDGDLDSTGARLVFSSTRHSRNPDLYLKSIDGLAVTQLTSDPASDIQGVISPDDTRVAFASDRGGNWDIWVVDVNGGPPAQVTHELADEIHPSFSPDGTKLVFCSLPSGGGSWELWVADAQAGGSKRFIGYGLFPEWAPDSDTILFQRARARGSRLFGIWTLTLVDSEPRYPTELAAGSQVAMIQPTWSPDGKRVAFVTVEPSLGKDAAAVENGSSSDVWVMNADGRGKVCLTDGYKANYGPVFSPDGHVYFTTDRSGNENIWSVLPARGPRAGASGDFLTGPAAVTPAPLDAADFDRTVQTTSVRERP